MADPVEGQAAAPEPTPTPTPTPEPSVNAEAIRAQLAAEFAAQLKAATGHESLEDLRAEREAAEAARLAEQGQFKQLAEKAQAEAASYRQRFEAQAVQAAILSAAAEAIDPATVMELLAGKAKVAESGAVTIAGKSAAEAVAGLLKDKPFLAKPAPGEGSGTPAASGPAPVAAPKRGDFADEISYHRAVAQYRASLAA